MADHSNKNEIENLRCEGMGSPTWTTHENPCEVYPTVLLCNSCEENATLMGPRGMFRTTLWWAEKPRCNERGDTKRTWELQNLWNQQRRRQVKKTSEHKEEDDQTAQWPIESNTTQSISSNKRIVHGTCLISHQSKRLRKVLWKTLSVCYMK